MTFGGVVFARGRDIVKEQNFNQQPANHPSAPCETAFVNFLEVNRKFQKLLYKKLQKIPAVFESRFAIFVLTRQNFPDRDTVKYLDVNNNIKEPFLAKNDIR